MKRIGLLLLCVFLSIALCLSFAAQEYRSASGYVSDRIRTVFDFTEEEKSIILEPLATEEELPPLYRKNSVDGTPIRAYCAQYQWLLAQIKAQYAGNPAPVEDPPTNHTYAVYPFQELSVVVIPTDYYILMRLESDGTLGKFRPGLGWLGGTYDEKNNISIDWDQIFYGILTNPEVMVQTKDPEASVKDMYLIFDIHKGWLLYFVTDRDNYVMQFADCAPGFPSSAYGGWHLFTEEEFQTVAEKLDEEAEAHVGQSESGEPYVGGGAGGETGLYDDHRIDVEVLLQNLQDKSSWNEKTVEVVPDPAVDGKTPADAVLTTGEAPESSNALLWIFGGVGAAVLAAAVVGWIWIRTRKRNESR